VTKARLEISAAVAAGRGGELVLLGLGRR
jgi:hypothetical protein